jgi:hypothetical protein
LAELETGIDRRNFQAWLPPSKAKFLIQKKANENANRFSKPDSCALLRIIHRT